MITPETLENLQCIQHPKYDGNTHPELSCRTCCQIFIARVKQKGAGTPVQSRHEDCMGQ